jgi:hypothetical protein
MESKSEDPEEWIMRMEIIGGKMKELDEKTQNMTKT